METKTKDLRLTPEMLDKLKATKALGFKVEASFKYVLKVYREDLKDDIPKNLWPVFTLRSKDGLETAGIEDTMYIVMDGDGKKPKTYVNSGRLRIETLKNGILSVKNFPFEDGSIMDYDKLAKKITTTDSEGNTKTQTNVGSEEIIKYITPDVQTELQNAINERSSLTEEELVGLEF